MIKLDYLDKSVRDLHFDTFAQQIKDRLDELVTWKWKLDTRRHMPGLRAFVTHLQTNIRKILVGRPDKLKAFIGTTTSSHGKFDAVFAKSAKSRTEREKDLVAGLRWAFDYDGFSKSAYPDWGGYSLVQTHELRICPYCHTSHLNFHVDSTKDIRPPLDHYYPRSRYPYLGVSLYNLIPCCYQCNSSVKSAKNPLHKKLTHPFEIDEKSVEFSLCFANGAPLPCKGEKVTARQIKIEVNGVKGGKKTVDFFLLQERYQWYRREIAEVHARVLSQRDSTGTLATLVGVKRFVYGFREAQVRDYALGICIKDIADSLIMSYSP